MGQNRRKEWKSFFFFIFTPNFISSFYWTFAVYMRLCRIVIFETFSREKKSRKQNNTKKGRINIGMNACCTREGENAVDIKYAQHSPYLCEFAMKQNKTHRTYYTKEQNGIGVEWYYVACTLVCLHFVLLVFIVVHFSQTYWNDFIFAKKK